MQLKHSVSPVRRYIAKWRSTVFNKNSAAVLGYFISAVGFACIGLYGVAFSHATLLSILAFFGSALFATLTLKLFAKQQQQFNEVINALKYQDSSFRLSETHTLGAKEQQICNDLIKKVQDDKFKQAEQVAIFETMLQHIDAGIILTKNQQDVVVCNNTAKRSLDIRTFSDAKELLTAKPILEQTKQGASVEDDMLFKYFTFNYHDNRYELWLFTTISEQIESTQMDSWQKLIRVLIHEIGNSVAPIYSLSNTLATITEQQLATQIDDQDLVDDYLQSLNAIGIRSQSLLGFIEDYRKLTHIPHLELQPLSVQSLFDDLQPLVKPQFDEANIAFTISIEPENLTVSGDKKMLEQVLVNLITNALDALKLSQKNEKALNITASINRYGKCEIAIQDNGDGIEASALEKIFVPFFTTKPKGSGIGLALSQQIIHRHKGRIKVASEVDEGARFSLVL
ncbi:ATP-binding protein [Pseudoalteromonas phenolica]|uniref:histidine kinase n=1 Tax=Pseudoalteromonas phenolica TaxID=161398 RepID=A0A5S3YU71_9GAMM|nr:ATP-binding protein [Pseudoalteromonas phenolica]